MPKFNLPPPRKKRYIEYILFLEDFRRSILEDPILKNSAPPKPWAPTMDHHGFFHCNRELSSTSSVSFYNLNIFRRHSCRSRRFAATISKEMQLMQVAGNVSLNLPNPMFFNQNLDFLTLTVKAMKPGKVHPFLRNAPNSIGFHGKAVFVHCSATRSWG